MSAASLIRPVSISVAVLGKQLSRELVWLETKPDVPLWEFPWSQRTILTFNEGNNNFFYQSEEITAQSNAQIPPENHHFAQNRKHPTQTNLILHILQQLPPKHYPECDSIDALPIFSQCSGKLESVGSLGEYAHLIIFLLDGFQPLVCSIAIALQYWLARHCIVHKDQIISRRCRIPSFEVGGFNTGVCFSSVRCNIIDDVHSHVASIGVTKT
jgi:hypothetical protein